MYHSLCREKPIAVVKALLVFPAAPSWAMARTEATPYGDKATFLSIELWASCKKTFRPKSVCLSCSEPSPTLLRVSKRKIYWQSILGKMEENRCEFDCGWFKFTYSVQRTHALDFDLKVKPSFIFLIFIENENSFSNIFSCTGIQSASSQRRARTIQNVARYVVQG